MNAIATLRIPSCPISAATRAASSRSSGTTVQPSAPSFSVTVKRRLRRTSGGGLTW